MANYIIMTGNQKSGLRSPHAHKPMPHSGRSTDEQPVLLVTVYWSEEARIICQSIHLRAKLRASGRQCTAHFLMNFLFAGRDALAIARASTEQPTCNDVIKILERAIDNRKYRQQQELEDPVSNQVHGQCLFINSTN